LLKADPPPLCPDLIKADNYEDPVNEICIFGEDLLGAAKRRFDAAECAGFAGKLKTRISV
jgi:hypothetical protein